MYTQISIYDWTAYRNSVESDIGYIRSKGGTDLFFLFRNF